MKRRTIFRHPFRELSLEPARRRAASGFGGNSLKRTITGPGSAFVAKERRIMRKQIGSLMVVLAALVAPTAVHAQELHKWYTLPLDWAAPPAAPAAPPPVEPRVARMGVPADDPPPTAWPAQRPYTTVRAQDIGDGSSVPPVDFVGPLSHPRYEEGGFFCGTEFVFWRQTRPILSQTVAVTGFLDTNGGILGNVNGFAGSGQEILNTNMVQGPGSYQPGMNIFLGYRFKNGWSVDLEWVHLAESRYVASAGATGNQFVVGPNGENTFLFAPVVNFPIQFAGQPANVLVNGVPAFGSTFGIWNAASEMQIQFIQRFEQVTLNNRIPVWETDNYRAYGTFGPRAIVMWEEFEWRTVSRDTAGQAAADTTANYSNITSNRLYGAYLGTGHDWYLGSTPVGAFAIDLNINGAFYLDFVKERAGYELGDKSIANNRAVNTYSVCPGIDGKLAGIWYPWEAIQIRVGYSFMALFNTYASPRPIDFNFGTINPAWTGGINRLFHGIDAGIAFVF
jgi:hypothetical protein